MSWTNLSLGEVASFSQGLQVSTKNQFLEKDDFCVRFIRIVDYTSDSEPPRYINIDNYEKYFVEEDDIVMIRYGSQTAGKVVRGISGVIANNTFKIKINQPDIDQNYLFHYLNQVQIYNRLNANQASSTMPAVSFGMVKNLNIPIPPLHTQKRISEILSAYDDLIENNLKRVKLLEQAAQNIYKEWFVHLRFPGHENTPINKETGLPEGWERNPFSDVAEFINGYAFKPRHHSKTGLPIIKIKELKNGVKEDTPRNTGEDIPDKYHFGDNTILFSWSASLDVYWWYGGASLLNQHLFKVIPNNELNKWHFFYGLKGAVEEFRSKANGATMKHIKRSELSTVFYTKPSIDLSQNFQIQIRPILQQVLVLSQKNQKLKAAKDILLPRLMNRTIEV